MKKHKEEKIKALEYEIISEFARIRRTQKISSQQLSKESGIIRNTINRIENHKQSPQMNTILNLLEKLDCTFEIVPLNEKNIN